MVGPGKGESKGPAEAMAVVMEKGIVRFLFFIFFCGG